MCGAEETILLTKIIEKSDVELATHLTERLPQRTYTNVQVTSLKYNFSGFARPPVPTRIVSLTVSDSEKLCGLFCAFLAAFGLSGSKAMDDYDSVIGQVPLAKEIIENLCNTAKEGAQIRRAFKQCTEIHLFISQDLNNLDIRFMSSDAIHYTYKYTVPVATLIGKVTGAGLFLIALYKFLSENHII